MSLKFPDKGKRKAVAMLTKPFPLEIGVIRLLDRMHD